MHVFASACLILIVPAEAKLEQLQPSSVQAQFTSTLTQLLGASSSSPIGIVYSRASLETDQASNWLQAANFSRLCMLFQLDAVEQCRYTGPKLMLLVMFVEDSKADISFNCTQAWNSKSKFLFVLWHHTGEIRKLAEAIWQRRKILDYLLLYADEQSRVRLISYNPFTNNFSKEPSSAASKLKNLHGFQIKAVYTLNWIEAMDHQVDDHILLLAFVSRMLNASFNITYQAVYNPYEQFEKVNQGEVDIDLNPAIVNWLLLENCIGVTYGGPLVTLIPKQSNFKPRFALLVFDYWSWMVFGVIFLALSIAICWKVLYGFEHSWKLLVLAQATLAFFFVNLFQIYVISALTSAGNMQTIDTIQELVERNMSIIVPLRMENYLPSQLKSQMKIVYISEAYGKLVGNEEPDQNQAIAIWQISFDKLKYARPADLDRFYTLKEPIGIISYARHSKANSPFRDSFELALARINEACLSRASCQNWEEPKREDAPQHHKLDLEALLNVFDILLLGCLASLGVFVAELLLAKVED